MSDDLVINVRQIFQYPPKHIVGPTDALLIQEEAAAGRAYRSIQANELVASALAAGGFLMLRTGDGIVWADRATLTYTPGSFVFSDLVTVPSLNAVDGLFDDGQRVATQCQFEWLKANSLTSFNGRVGAVQLEEVDILRAGAAPVNNPHFTGWVTAPTVWDTRQSDDTVATTAWVQNTLCAWLNGAATTSLVTSFNGRHGDIVLSADDVSAALLGATAPNYGKSLTPPFGDVSQRISTTAFVDEAVEDLRQWVEDHVQGQQPDLSAYAPLASPQFTGTPTAPTPPNAASDGRLATTAFVHNLVTAATTGVASFNTRTGAVVLLAADVTAVGGALLASPTFTGTPAGPTAAPGTNTVQLATTAYVQAALAAEATSEVSSFNGRVGAITLTTADVTGAGGAPINNAALTGTPTAPTPVNTDNSTRIATTAFVQGLLASAGGGVTSFNGRTGTVSLQASDVSAVGGALLAGPAFSGVPSAPTAAPGTNTTQLATTAYVQAALAAGNVTSFNGRTGAITLSLADITNAGGAPISSPAFTGTATSTTVSTTVNDNTIATTAFVHNLVSTSAGVASFNTRTGAVTLNAGDITGAGGALLASPAFTGIPVAATAAPGTSTTQLATCAFVAAAVNASVLTFNGRSGAVSFQASDISGAGGALLAGPTFTGIPSAPTATTGTNTTQLATCAFVQAALAAGGGVLSFNGRAGTVTLTGADITGAGGALLASPTFTGTPAAPTPVATDNSTTIATTAFVTAKINAAVVSFNGRTGTVTLQAGDVTGVGGAMLASPAFSGNPTAPTPAPGDNDTSVATTAFVTAAVAAAPYAPLANPAFTGAPTAPTAALNTNSTQIATTAFVLGQATVLTPVMDGTAAVGVATTWARGDHVHPSDTSRAPLASPTFTGVPAGPTAAPGTNTTQLASTAFVAASFAPLASPALTGTPSAPTAAAHTNNTQVASTAYVDAAVAASAGSPAIFAYWGGTVVITQTAVSVSANGNATGILTFPSAHGVTTGQFGIATGTAPGAIGPNNGWYLRAASTTTLTLHPTLADAKNNTNPLQPTGAGTGFAFKVLTYTAFISKNFDAVCPIGGATGRAQMQFELNLSAALPQTVNALVFLERCNGLFNAATTPAAATNWINGVTPVIINSSLLRFDTGGGMLSVTAGSSPSAFGVGIWASQGTSSFYIGLSIIA